MANKFNDFYEAWCFLETHRYYTDDHIHRINRFEESLYIEVVKVNPKTERIEDDETLNTDVRVWLESGCPELIDDVYELTHDIELDCGAPTFEEAIIELANLVYKNYGESKYTEKEDKEKTEFWAKFVMPDLNDINEDTNN